MKVSPLVLGAALSAIAVAVAPRPDQGVNAFELERRLADVLAESKSRSAAGLAAPRVRSRLVDDELELRNARLFRYAVGVAALLYYMLSRDGNGC